MLHRMSDPDRYRVVYSAPFGSTLFLALGASIMIPFGALLLAGLVFGVPKLLVDLVHERHADTLASLRAIGSAVIVIGFGGFLTYALLRHGVGSLIDLVGARRVVEGEVTARRVARGTRGVTRYVTVCDEVAVADESAYAEAFLGRRVRMRFGRFERQIVELAVPRFVVDVEERPGRP